MLMHMRLRPRGLLVAALLVFGMVAYNVYGEGAVSDDTLVLHYTFDADTGSVAKDLSSYGNDGEIVKAEYLKEADGRSGVLRFDGESSYLNCGNSESLYIGGDMSFEMWARLNGLPGRGAVIFGEANGRSFFFQRWGYQNLVLGYRDDHPVHGWEQMVLPVDRNILNEEWSHIAVVVEYPRCRFYHNGELVRDAYMPIPAIAKMGNQPKHLGGKKGAFCPMDLDEFRLYRRALTAAEVAAHAAGKEAPPGREIELAVEPQWYEDNVALRLSCKGTDYAGHTAEMTLLAGDYTEAVPSQTAPLTEAFEGCGRYVAKVTFPLSRLQGKSLDAVARILGPDGRLVEQVYRHVSLKKPDWVHSREGYSEGVLPPWTPVEAEAKPDGAVEVRVWGRRQQLGPTAFFRKIETQGAEILSAPMRLTARADGADLSWKSGRTTLTRHSDTVALIEQTFENPNVQLRIHAEMEYDGYNVFDCSIQARKQISLERLTLEIPLKTRHATLCYGNRVLPKDPKVPISEWYSGAVRGDLAFRFSGNVWLGDEDRGLCWQAESDEDWHYADKQKAVEILPRGETTTFRANLVDVPTQLEAGEKLHYKFALLATPAKPLLRDAWDLRLARHEPWGRLFNLPERKTDGEPALDYLREVGLRHIFYRVADIWPYPMPVHEQFSRALHQTINEVHASGLRLYPYLIHERFPTIAPEFDIHGLHMANRPTRWYVQSGPPHRDHPRPGPLVIEYGSNSQGCLFMCAKSMALQDAYIHSLAKRMDEYGDDGVYLDGTAAIVSCQNMLHGCGYRTEDGSIRPTHPVFGVREFMKRIYTVVKGRRPDGVVDLHASFGQNYSGLAYADMLWTGEHWWHLRNSGGPTDGYVSGVLPLKMFRTEFMGRQGSVAAETLSYRLGPRMKVAAISLLHDVPVRVTTPYGAAGPYRTAAHATRDKTYFECIAQLWKVRDQFGANEAEKLFYWRNQDYVRVSPEKCYSTLLKHPNNGVLAIISNLRRDAQTVSVEFNLEKLALKDKKLNVFNVLTDEPLAMTADGKVSVPLGSEEWIYVWLRPTAVKAE